MSESKQPKPSQADGGKIRAKPEELSRHQFTFETAGAERLDATPDEAVDDAPSRLLDSTPSAILQRQPTSPAVARTDHARPTFRGRDFAGVPAYTASHPAVQPKLTVGPAGDRFEQEADRVAEQVMAMPAPVVAPPAPAQPPAAGDGGKAGGGSPPAQRQVPEQAPEEEEKVQTKPLAAAITPLVRRAPEEEEEKAPTEQPAQGAAEEEDEIRTKRGPAAGGFEANDEFESRLAAQRGGGHPLPNVQRAFMEPRFGADFSGVRVHTDGEAARLNRAISARAFTHGQDIFLGEGQADLESSAGQRLLAHELTHVVQQGGGPMPATTERAARGLLQRRRVPGGADLEAALPADADLANVRPGLARALSRAWGELTAEQRAAVRAAAAGLVAWTTEAELLAVLSTATRAQLISFAQAIRAADPTAELGDPRLINVGARAGTDDVINIAKLVTKAKGVFAKIAAENDDINANIAEIFGEDNVDDAKGKYGFACLSMNYLHETGKIVTDRSGFSEEVSLAGRTNFEQITLAASVIDDPENPEHVITLIHESMHAGNNDVRDFGYISQGDSFKTMGELVKLTNAAHFEVVPRRILAPSSRYAFVGQTFIPAGTTVSGVAAPEMTPREKAIRAASETFRLAWHAGLGLHKQLVQVFNTPAEWNMSNLPAILPFWSKVEGLTIHTRAASIDPAGAPAVRPVTLIDIALSEGLIRKLHQGMASVPKNEAAADELERAVFERLHAAPGQLETARASVEKERKLLIKLVIRQLGSITGDASRDERVVARLAEAGEAGSSGITAIHDLSEFSD